MPMLTAVVIPAQTEQPATLEYLEMNNLDAYRRLVDGSIEVVELERPSASLYVNEEGKLIGLPLNPRATALLWVHNAELRGQDIVVGDAFVVGPPDDQGDDTAAPSDLVDLLFYRERYRVQTQAPGSSEWRDDQEVLTDWYDAYMRGVHLMRLSANVEQVRITPELEDELRAQWYQIGIDEPAIRTASDPPFTRSSFVGCYSVEELEERLSHGNWVVGTAFYYRDLCFIQRIDGGDEWLTIRHGVAFKSISFEPIIERGEFASLVQRLLTATKERCQRLEY